jgi:hypothetical protein
MEQTIFQNALRNFMNDFASGDAVRHLADQGLSVTEITRKLTFPTKKELVAEMVWKHYLDTGRIRLLAPEKGTVRKVRYVKDEGPYGKTSLRQVVEEVPAPEAEYVAVDFGKQIYRDRAAFLQKLDALSEEDRQYVLDLPWPLVAVWHVKDERMERIAACVDKS